MSNSVSIKSENSSKMYSVKLSCFEKLIERELNSYLKHLNSLGCLSVSVREARAAVSSGVAVSVPSKKCGRPRKSIRKVDDKDIIADLTAKANDDSCEKPVSHDEKAVAKAAKLAAKEKAKAEKLAAKELAKAAKLAAKEKAKAEKLAAKEKAKAEKLAAKEKAKAEKLAAKKKAKAEKLAAKEQEKAAKKAAKAALKAEKAAKAKKELERKTKEAKELKKKFNMDKAKAEHTELVEEEILNEKGEVVGSKVAGFNVPPQKKIIEDEKDQHEEFELPEGFEIFQHQSRPNETLYKDDSDDVFAKSGGELQHIAHYDSASNNLLQLSDSDSDEEELGELSDTE